MGFLLHQFSDVFKLRDASGQPYILIGGQAVNYWAEQYLSSEPELKSLQPFTSQDIDFKGNADDVRHIAEQLKSSAHYPPKVAMTALAGIVPIQIGGEKSVIEVVRQIPGISSSKRTPAVEARWENKTIRLLDPISLLASKLELVVTIPQAKRQDVPHLKILVPCVRAFLRDLLQQVEIGHLPARDWLKVDWSGILPFLAIDQSKNEKIRRFHEQQLQ